MDDRIPPSRNDGERREPRLVRALAHGLGIDYSDRLNGLDDLRRYVTILRDALGRVGPWASIEQLFEAVTLIVRTQPFRQGRELLNAVGTAASIEGSRLVYDLCVAMERRAEVSPTLGDFGRRTFSLPTCGRTIDVEFFVPPAIDVERMPILIVLHGILRNPGHYLESWLPFGVVNGYAVIAPHFSGTDFPGSAGYNQGGVVCEDGGLTPRTSWAFQVIEDLFDAVKAWTGSQVPTYDVFGHSAGAQFVHRMMMLCPEARVATAIAANAGWYTLPDFGLEYPYGLGGSPVSESQLRRSLAGRLVVLLGDQDVDSNDPTLRRSELALAQGAHRFERGLGFYRAAMDVAARWGIPLGWAERMARGVGHDQEAMVPFASDILIETRT